MGAVPTYVYTKQGSTANFQYHLQQTLTFTHRAYFTMKSFSILLACMATLAIAAPTPQSTEDKIRGAALCVKGKVMAAAGVCIQS
jgi:hypothetical protein